MDLIRPCIRGSNARVGRTWRALIMANRHSVGLGEALLRGEGRPDGRPGDCVRGRSQRALPRHAESAPRGGRCGHCGRTGAARGAVAGRLVGGRLGRARCLWAGAARVRGLSARANGAEGI